MKKLIAGLLVSVTLLTTSLASHTEVKAWGNQSWYDTDYTFNKAIINTFDGKKEVTVKEWDDFEDGVNIQIVATDGTVYYTNSENCVLIYSK